MEKIVIGISSCLLGSPVRYDGGHAKDTYLVNTWGKYFEYLPICPELEAGLGVPREPMRLEGDPENPSLVAVNTRRDITEILHNWAYKKVEALKGIPLSGFIFKSKSPSCGVEGVKVYGKDGVVKKGIGIFATYFIKTFPFVPVEEDAKLTDIDVRENFIERVFVLQSWRELYGKSANIHDLIVFHTRYKYIIMAHSPVHYKEMGRIVGNGSDENPMSLFNKYGELLLKALSIKATVKKHTNVLLHLLGYFKKELTHKEKEELLSMIDAYYKGGIPLLVPLTMLRHYANKFEKKYLLEQAYLTPHPIELKLKNHS